MARNYLPTKFLRSPFQVPSIFEELEQFPSIGEDSGLTISEDDQNVFIEAAMPGLKNSEIDVTIDNGVIFITGEKTEEEEDKKKKFHRRATSSFSYRISIPSQVDESKDPVAKYDQGVLKLTFEKTRKGQSKRITIN